MTKFLHLKGKTPAEIQAELKSVYGDAAPSFTTVKTWVGKFKRDRTSIFDEERSGRSKTATTDKIIDYVHQIVIDDRRLILREISDAASISHERVHILH